MPEPLQIITYLVDHADRIVSASASWNHFAEENGAHDLKHIDKSNKTCLDWIKGPETRMIYESLFKRVRENNMAVSFPFRCDAPALRRFLTMHLQPREKNGIEIKTILEKVEARDPVPVLMESPPRGSNPIKVCSWCKKIHGGGEIWLEIEDFLERHQSFQEASLPPITHGICGPCEETVSI